ncbi:Gem-associated protein 7 (Gemin7) [Halocaridina rubra]|uniref:Gem-associated protein 7 (Gemin7) n=1 Tax=Halocaridina rubra TaxID=373956 RepID=A0AAN8WXI6_HALRR
MKMDEELVSNEKEDERTFQECRAELRERFLWAVTSLVGKDMELRMLEDIKVSGVFRGIDKDVLSVHMQNLKTPAVTHPYATIRLPDCCSMKCSLKI